MPSPFPGVDPYLENRHLWPVFHKAFISLLMVELNTLLPPGFVASQDERVYLTPTYREILPDSLIFRQSRRGESTALPIPDSPGGVAVLPASYDPPVILEPTVEEIREPFVLILATQKQEQVITVIELLSPKNKYRSSDGWETYRNKQQEILKSDVHLLELDFLRGGNDTVAPSRDRLADQEPFDYIISLRRARNGDRYEVWPFGIQEVLPRIPIPLTGSYPDLILDTSTVYNRTFDGGRFGQRVDYTSRLTPRLSKADQAWVDALLESIP